MPSIKYKFFDFINVLTKTEKGQFIKYASSESKKEDSKQLKLFKAVQQMDSYNELKAIRSATYTSRNTFAKGRMQLLEQLQRFLRYAEAKKSKQKKNISIQLHETIIDILILHERAASDLLVQKLNGAIKLARQQHLNNELLRLLQLQKTYLRQGYQRNFDASMEDVNEEITELIQRIQLEQEVIRHYDKLFIHEQKLDMCKRKELLKNAIRDFEKQKIQASQLTLKAFMAYYFIQAKYYKLIVKQPESVAAQWKYMIDFLEQDPMLKAEHQERYLNIYYNYYANLILAGLLNKTAFEQALSHLKNIKPKTSTIKHKITQHLCYYRLQYNNMTGNYQGIIAMHETIEMLTNKPEQYGLNFERKSLLEYYLAVAYFSKFISESNELDLQQAIALANTLDAKKEGDSETETRLKTKLLLASIAYYQENDMLFETHYNAIRYLCRKEELENSFAVGKKILFALNNARKAPLDDRKNHFRKVVSNMTLDETIAYREFVAYLEVLF